MALKVDESRDNSSSVGGTGSRELSDFAVPSLVAMEAAAAAGDALDNGQALPMAGAPKAKKIELDEADSPVEGRRFSRA